MPIRITPKPEKDPVRQTQIERMYRASLAGFSDLDCLLREQTSFDLNKVLISARTWTMRVLTVLESLGQRDQGMRFCQTMVI